MKWFDKRGDSSQLVLFGIVGVIALVGLIFALKGGSTTGKAVVVSGIDTSTGVATAIDVGVLAKTLDTVHSQYPRPRPDAVTTFSEVGATGVDGVYHWGYVTVDAAGSTAKHLQLGWDSRLMADGQILIYDDPIDPEVIGFSFDGGFPATQLTLPPTTTGNVVPIFIHHTDPNGKQIVDALGYSTIDSGAKAIVWYNFGVYSVAGVKVPIIDAFAGNTGSLS